MQVRTRTVDGRVSAVPVSFQWEVLANTVTPGDQVRVTSGPLPLTPLDSATFTFEASFAPAIIECVTTPCVCVCVCCLTVCVLTPVWRLPYQVLSQLPAGVRG